MVHPAPAASDSASPTCARYKAKSSQLIEIKSYSFACANGHEWCLCINVVYNEVLKDGLMSSHQAGGDRQNIAIDR
jgi:hypothetical protein